MKNRSRKIDFALYVGVISFEPIMKRLLASILLGALVLSAVPAPMSGAPAAGHGCPVAPAPDGLALSSVPHHDCDDAGLGPCRGALHCLSILPAVLGSAAEVVAPAAPETAVPAAAVAPHSRPALGPPTPPPNS